MTPETTRRNASERGAKIGLRGIRIRYLRKNYAGAVIRLPASPRISKPSGGLSNMVNPIKKLAVARIKTGIHNKRVFQHFHFLNVIQNEIAIAFLPSGFGKPERLPAHKHDAIARSPAYPVRVDQARKRFSPQSDPAHLAIL